MEDKSNIEQGREVLLRTPRHGVCLPTAGPCDCVENRYDEGEGTDQGDPVRALATAPLALSPADRERLAAVTIGHQGNSEAD